jgi:hypothetical protein
VNAVLVHQATRARPVRCGRFTSCCWRPRATDAPHAEPLRPRTTHRPTLRQATALGPKSPRRQRHRHQGAHGEPHRSEPSSTVLASWATSTARLPEGSGPGLPVRDADAPGIPRTSNPQGPDSSFDVPAAWMRARRMPTHRIDGCLSKTHALCNPVTGEKYGGSPGCPRRPGRVHARFLHVFTIFVQRRESGGDSILTWMGRRGRQRGRRPGVGAPDLLWPRADRDRAYSRITFGASHPCKAFRVSTTSGALRTTRS